MKILVSGLTVLSKERKEEKDWEFGEKSGVTKPHISYACFDSENLALVTIRDFKFETTYEIGDNIEEEFNISKSVLSKLDIK